MNSPQFQISPHTNKKSISCLIFCALLIVFSAASFGDTFTNPANGKTLHGYPTQRVSGSRTWVHTEQNGSQWLDLSQWQFSYNRKGRNNSVVSIPVDDAILLESQVRAVKTALKEAVNKGPLFVLLEIDTPGGRTDLTKQICSDIDDTSRCPVIAFVKGGDYGGAISAGVALSLACDKIYMAENTIMGAATNIALVGDKPTDLKEAFGEVVGEKFSSAWRAYLAGLAQKNDRPGIIARAMVNKDIEVVELEGKNLENRFVDPANVQSNQQVARTWSKVGSLLTLTAREAVEVGMADGIAENRQQLLQKQDANDAKVSVDVSYRNAQRKYKRACKRYQKLREQLDLTLKQLEMADSPRNAMKLLNKAEGNMEQIKRLARLYPDLKVDKEKLQKKLNTIEAFQRRVGSAVRRARRRR